jgi:hypothetical protein
MVSFDEEYSGTVSYTSAQDSKRYLLGWWFVGIRCVYSNETGGGYKKGGLSYTV